MPPGRDGAVHRLAPGTWDVIAALYNIDSKNERLKESLDDFSF